MRKRQGDKHETIEWCKKMRRKTYITRNYCDRKCGWRRHNFQRQTHIRTLYLRTCSACKRFKVLEQMKKKRIFWNNKHKRIYILWGILFYSHVSLGLYQCHSVFRQWWDTCYRYYFGYFSIAVNVAMAESKPYGCCFPLFFAMDYCYFYA